MSQSFSSPTLFYVSALCGDVSSKWYSPARLQRTIQVSRIFSNLCLSTIFVSSLSPDKCINFQNKVYSLGVNTSFLFRYCYLFFSSVRFLYLCYKYKPGYICIYNSRFPEFILCILALFFYKATFVVEIEDLPLARSQNSGLAGFLDFVSTKVYSFLGLKFISVSDSVSLFLNKTYGVKYSNIQVLPPSLTEDYLSTVSKRRKPFSDKTIKIMYAGGYSPEKGVEELVNCYLDIRKSLKAELHLVGPISDKISGMVLNYSDILVYGTISRDELLNNMLSVDVLVNPHRVDHKSAYIFPFKAIEMSASGCLFLTTRMPGIDKLGLHHECLVNSYSELSYKLLNSRILWNQNSSEMIVISKQICYKYSTDYQSKTIRGFLID